LSKINEESLDETLEAIKDYYNGYSWDGKNFVYNPYSTILLFYFKEFSNYWFDSGTPTFLIELLKEKNDLDGVFKESKIGSHISISFNSLKSINTTLLMFQTGYLTVKKKEIIDRRSSFTLSIPNEEVRESIAEYLLSAYTEYALDQMGPLRFEMRQNIINKDSKGLEDNIKELMANIPYQLKDTQNENYYHSLFLLMIVMFGFEIDGEIQTHNGRIDAVMKINNDIHIIEIKLAKKDTKITSELEDALNQIHKKHYYDKYLHKNSITLVPMAYSENDTKCEFIDFKS